MTQPGWGFNSHWLTNNQDALCFDQSTTWGRTTDITIVMLVSHYWYSTGIVIRVLVRYLNQHHSTGTVLVLSSEYGYYHHSTGAVLVLSPQYWYQHQSTGIIIRVLVLSSQYWSHYRQTPGSLR